MPQVDTSVFRTLVSFGSDNQTYYAVISCYIFLNPIVIFPLHLSAPVLNVIATAAATWASSNESVSPFGTFSFQYSLRNHLYLYEKPCCQVVSICRRYMQT